MNPLTAAFVRLISGPLGLTKTYKSTIICGAVPVQLLKPNPTRIAYLIQNLSGNIVYVDEDENVSAASGNLLTNNGGSMDSHSWEDEDETREGVWAIATGAGSNVRVRETLSLEDKG